MRWLRQRLDLAAAGDPQCVLLVGEAGIGKTRLALELRSLAIAEHFEPLAGRAYEDVQVPFLPLRDDVLPALVHHCEQTGRPCPDALVVDEPGGGDPFSHGAGPDVAGRALLELAALLLDAAARAPRFVLLEDLHWADRASIELLRHVVYRLAGRLPRTRLLLVTTAQPDAAIEPLEREHHCAVLELQGLGPLEAADLARRLGTSRALPDASIAATGGNPRAIEAAARADRTDGERAGRAAGDGSALPPACRAVLAWSALLVPDASRATLAALERWDDETLDAALRAAFTAGILVEDGAHLAFASARQRREWIAELDPVARRQAHAAAARVLGPPVGPALPSVARHLVGAGSAADPVEVARVTEAAGRAAVKVCAWEEAAELFAASIAASRAAPASGSTADLADRHVLAGKCRQFALDAETAQEHFEAAAALSASIGDDAGELRARAEHLLTRISAGPVGRAEVEPVATLADALSEREPALGAEALVDISQAEWTQLRLADARATIDRALALAEPRHLHVAAERAYVSRAVTEWMTMDLPAALESLRRADEHAIACADPTRRIGPVYRRPLTLLWLGEVAEAERACDEATELSEAVRSQYEFVLVLAARVSIAALRGEHHAAEDLAEHALRLQRLSGYQWAAGLYLPVLALSHLERGDPVRAETALAEWDRTADEVSRIPLRLLRDLVAVRSGHAGEETLDRLPQLPDPPMLGAQDWAILAVELASRLGRPAAAERPVALIEATIARGMRISSSLGRSLERTAADGLAMLGHVDDARTRYDAAIELADRTGAVAEGALARLGLARLMAGRERPLAARALRAALPALERLRLAPALREADEVAAELGTDLPHSAATDVEPVAQTATVLFFDVVDSTRLTEQLGDVAYWHRARGLEARLRAVVAQSGGTTLPGVNVGDGLIALFERADRALEAGLGGVAAAEPTQLRLHVGLHHGPVLRRGDTLYGTAVNLAARVCASSGVDEVLVSEPVRRLVGDRLDHAVAFVDRGTHTLKGVEAPQRLFAAVTPT
jgi:class 3 adenylate cyclase